MQIQKSHKKFRKEIFNFRIVVIEGDNHIQLSKMNITPLAILGVKWPFSKERGG